MTISTTHKGHDIIWSDNSDEWYCSVLGKSNKSLIALKRMIDKRVRLMRSEIAVKCFMVRSGEDRLIVEYIGDDRYNKNRVATVKDGEQHRNQEPLADLARDTEDNRAKLARVNDLLEKSRLISKEIGRVRDSMERVTLDDIAGLVKFSADNSEDRA